MHTNIWADGMLGVIVGDALGVPVQFSSGKEIKSRAQGPVTGMEGHGTYDMPAGTWSDDSSMALATLDSLVKAGSADMDDIMRRFLQWEFEGEYTPYGSPFDEGITCTSALYHYKQNGDISTCGAVGEYANGNGALMRIMPICLYAISQVHAGKLTQKDAVMLIHTAGSLTHNHLRSHTACGLYYFMADAVLKMRQSDYSLQNALQRGIDRGIAFYKEANLDGELSHYNHMLDLKALAETPVDQIRSGGYVVETMQGVLWSLIKADSLPEAMLRAVNLGHDTDTVAAIAGGLAGLWYGADSIPQDWLQVIPRLPWILSLCEDANAAFPVFFA